MPINYSADKERKEYKALIRDKRQSHLQILKDRVNLAHNPNDFWKAVNSFRRKKADPNPIKEEECKLFYDEILPKREPFPAFQGACDEFLDAQFTKKELQDALKKSKPAEFFKNLSEVGMHALLNILNEIWLNETFPEDWSTSITVMIFKKGDSNDPANYRPITLLNAIMNIFIQVLTTRLSTWANKNNILPEDQAGFRGKRGCDDQIFNLNTAIQIGTRNKKKVFALFIDFQIAFPSILHKTLWSELHHLGVSPKMIRTFSIIYSKCNTRI
jgi:hypothetical protein